MKPSSIVACMLALVCVNGWGQSTWWSAPSTNPVTNDLNGICFATQLRGWSVGLNGTIAHTTDGGNTWFSQYSENTLVLRNVCFVDSLRGWAIGRNSLPGYVARVFRTVNGGVNWLGRMCGVEDAVWFLTADVGFAAGVGGTIRRSTDGGETWNDLPKMTTRRLRGMFFLNATLGWCVGDSGAIVRTSDGGTTWMPVSSPVSHDLRSVHFSTVSDGWTVGAYGSILCSTDGGATWAEQTSGTGASLHGVRAIDNMTVLATGEGGLVLRTSDGGATWRGQSTGTTKTIGAVWTLSSQRAWIAGKEGLLLSTTAGGGPADFMAPATASPADGAIGVPSSPVLTWRTVATGGSYSVQLALDRAFTKSLQQKTGLVDTSTSFTGLIGDSAYYWRVGRLYGNGPIVWSPPAGFRTAVSVPLAPATLRPSNEPMVPTTLRLVWRSTRMASRYRLQLSESASFFAPLLDTTSITDTTCLVSGLQHSGVAFTRYYFWRVSAINDAGEGPFSEYASFKTDTEEWRRMDYDAVAKSPGGFHFVSPQIGYLGTSGRRVYRTTDGGTHWSGDTLPPPAADYHWAKGLSFTDDLNGLVITDYGDIFKTSDGGHHWSHRASSSWGWFRGKIVMVSATAGFAQSQTPALQKTTDAGETWSSAYVEPSGNGIAAFHFEDASAGWVAVGGVSKIVRRTTDGGVTWDSALTAAPSYLRAITAGGKDTVFVGGNGGYIARSTDGGKTWLNKNTGISASSHISALAAFDAMTLLAGDLNGGIYWSTSAGESWGVSHNMGREVGSLQFASRNVAFAAMDGALLKSTSAAAAPTSVDGEHLGETAVPAATSLFQNYPNPFNPLTTIRYGVPARVYVTLEIYNTLGQHVASLVRGNSEAGFHEVRFDAGRLPSGVYYCRLQAGNVTTTRRLVLLR